MGTLFSGIGSLFGGVRGLFGGSGRPSPPPAMNTGSPDLPGNQQGRRTGLFNGSTPLFEGQRKFIPPNTSPPPGLPLGQGVQPADPSVPNVYTYSSIYNSAQRTFYWQWDEAYRRSRADALAMRRDDGMMRLLRERQMPTEQMPWHVEVKDVKGQRLPAIEKHCTTLIEHIADLEQYDRAMLEGIWYGRAGSRQSWGRTPHGITVVSHDPVNGDKIQHTFEGIPQIMIHGATPDEDLAVGTPQEATTLWVNQSRVLQLDKPYWRDRYCIYYHDCVDSDFFEADLAGARHGIGVRSFLYWNWWLSQELQASVMEFMQRVGLGITILRYEGGNPAAEAAAQKYAAQGNALDTWLVWPDFSGDVKIAKPVERVETPTAGAEVLRGLIEYFDARKEKFVVGQSMSADHKGSGGLGGSGAATFAQDTKQQLIKSDCSRMGSAKTRDLLGPMLRYNYPGQQYFGLLKYDVDTPEPESVMEAVTKACSVGVTFKMDEVRSLIPNMTKPEPGDETVGGQQQGQPGQGGGLFGGQPGGGQSRPGQGQSSGDMFEGKTPVERDSRIGHEPAVHYDNDAGERWLTIGGHEVGGKAHVGGFPVQIDGDGRILKGGPKELRGKKIDEVHHAFQQMRGKVHGPPKPEAAEAPPKPKASNKAPKAKAVRGEMATATRVGKGEDAKVILADGTPAPAHITPGMIPPAWTDVKVSLDPSADLLVQGKDAKGRPKSVYADNFHMKSAAIKFARTKEMLEKATEIRAQVRKDLFSKDKKTRENACCAMLMLEQATRPGSDEDTGAKVKAYGATTLEARHVVIGPDRSVTLDFIGKEGVRHVHKINDPALAQILIWHKNRAGTPNSKLFDTNYGRVAAYAEKLDGGKFTPKDFRTNRANELAIEHIKTLGGPAKNEKEYKARVKAVAERVSGVLGNRPRQALESYIDPVVFSGLQPIAAPEEKADA